jgi:hypothetical protein
VTRNIVGLVQWFKEDLMNLELDAEVKRQVDTFEFNFMHQDFKRVSNKRN